MCRQASSLSLGGDWVVDIMFIFELTSDMIWTLSSLKICESGTEAYIHPKASWAYELSPHLYGVDPRWMLFEPVKM